MQVAELLRENSFRAGGRDGVIVQNNPVNWIDPEGKFAFVPVIAAIVVGYGVLESIDFATNIYFESSILKHLQKQEAWLKDNLDKTDCNDVARIDLLNDAIKENALKQTRIALGLGKDTLEFYYGKATDRQ